MKHIYCVHDQDELSRCQQFVSDHQKEIENYIHYLTTYFQVKELPNAIVWTNQDIACELISDIPIPAYTNEYRIVFDSDLDTWKEIYLKQLEQYDLELKVVQEINDYYEHSLTSNHILKILGHELTHHSELFLEDFTCSYSNGIWFEEGMVEYISRKYFLTEEQFIREIEMNQKLVDLYKENHSISSLEDFGKSTYNNDITSIFFEYWRSFLAIYQIINSFDEDIMKVFESYHKWNRSNTSQTLLEWFNLEK